MELTGYEARRLQELEQRLAVDDPDLASLLATKPDEPERPPIISARRALHRQLAGGAEATATAMLIALTFLAVLVLGAMALSDDGSAAERQVSECQTDCNGRYAPGE